MLGLEFRALPELSANIGGVALQSIKLANEGWERDEAVVEPEEPSLAERRAVA